MKNPTGFDRLKQALITTALFVFVSAPGVAQDATPIPPAANDAQSSQSGDAAAVQPPITGNSLSDEDDDFDSSSDPYSRGCPYGDNDLELVS